MRFDRQLITLMSVRLTAVLLLLGALPVHAADQYYDATFRAEIEPRRTTILVELEIRGDRLPSRIEFHIDPERHRAFKSSDPVSQQGKVVTWLPTGKIATVRYEFLATNERSPKRYDSLVTDEWAVFRADKMVPRMAVTSRRSLHGRTTLSFALPKGWSAATAYPEKKGLFRIEDPERRHDRPSGWVIAGKLGIRSEVIKGIQTIVAAPEGEQQADGQTHAHRPRMPR